MFRRPIMRWPVWALVLISSGAAALGCAGSATTDQEGGGSEGASGDMLKARAELSPANESGVSGTVTFTQTDDGVRILALVAGLEPGEHGFHIHEFGDCSAPDASSAGGHFDPTEMPHAGPDAAQRHVGDLGNIVADESGQASYERIDAHLELEGPNSIVGRAVVVHAGADDMTSQPSGAAGARVACGVIEAAP